MTQQNDANGGLYFIVGALLVAVVALGVMLMSSEDTGIGNIEPAAGMEETVDQTTSSFEIDVDDDSISGTTTQSNEN